MALGAGGEKEAQADASARLLALISCFVLCCLAGDLPACDQSPSILLRINQLAHRIYSL